MRTLIPAAAFFAAMSASAAVALPMSDYPEYHGIWSTSCKDRTADHVEISAGSFTIHQAGHSYSYRYMDFSHSGGNAHADGKRAWIFVGKAPASGFSFVAEVPGTFRKGPLVLDDHGAREGLAFKALLGKKLQKCQGQ